METAFLSLTDDRTVALDYARLGEAQEATIFELELGKASLGAEVAWLSQWPQEQARLLPPWTYLEVVEVVRGDGLAVIKMKPTVFQNVRTVEEVSGARKGEIRAHMEGLVRELRNHASYALVKLPQRKPGSSPEDVNKKLEQYDWILTNVAYRSASNALTVDYQLPQAEADKDAFITRVISESVDNWAGKRKGSARRNIAVALQKILSSSSQKQKGGMDIQGQLQSLRPQSPPWTAVEEACVKKCLELKSLPFTTLLHKQRQVSHVHLGQPALDESTRDMVQKLLQDDDDEGEAGFSAVLLMCC